MADTPSHLSELLSNRWALQREIKRIDLINWLQKDSRRFTVQRFVSKSETILLIEISLKRVGSLKSTPAFSAKMMNDCERKTYDEGKRQPRMTEKNKMSDEREIMKNLLSTCELVTFQFVCSAFFYFKLLLDFSIFYVFLFTLPVTGWCTSQSSRPTFQCISQAKHLVHRLAYVTTQFRCCAVKNAQKERRRLKSYKKNVFLFWWLQNFISAFELTLVSGKCYTIHIAQRLLFVITVHQLAFWRNKQKYCCRVDMRYLYLSWN